MNRRMLALCGATMMILGAFLRVVGSLLGIAVSMTGVAMLMGLVTRVGQTGQTRRATIRNQRRWLVRGGVALVLVGFVVAGVDRALGQHLATTGAILLVLLVLNRPVQAPKGDAP